MHRINETESTSHQQMHTETQKKSELKKAANEGKRKEEKKE